MTSRYTDTEWNEELELRMLLLKVYAALALVTLLALALSLAPVLLLVTLPLLLVTKARKLIQHEEKNKKQTQHCKTVLVTGAPHTKVNNECVRSIISEISIQSIM